MSKLKNVIDTTGDSIRALSLGPNIARTNDYLIVEMTGSYQDTKKLTTNIARVNMHNHKISVIGDLDTVINTHRIAAIAHWDDKVVVGYNPRYKPDETPVNKLLFITVPGDAEDIDMHELTLTPPTASRLLDIDMHDNKLVVLLESFDKYEILLYDVSGEPKLLSSTINDVIDGSTEGISAKIAMHNNVIALSLTQNYPKDDDVNRGRVMVYDTTDDTVDHIHDIFAPTELVDAFGTDITVSESYIITTASRDGRLLMLTYILGDGNYELCDAVDVCDAVDEDKEDLELRLTASDNIVSVCIYGSYGPSPIQHYAL